MVVIISIQSVSASTCTEVTLIFQNALNGKTVVILALRVLLFAGPIAS